MSLEIKIGGQITIGDTPPFYEIQTDESTNKRFAVITSAARDAKGAFAIPAEIEGCPVTSIREYAFFRRSGLTSVTIPNGVTSIGKGAFYGCYGLTSVTIPDSVTSIGKEAFSGCSGLTSVRIGNGVTEVGSCAFEDCDELTAVHVSDLAAWYRISFGDNPLRYAHNLYLNGSLVTQLKIPDGVTSIGEHAFWGCSSLTSMTIPDSVTSIGYGAFFGCSGLRAVHISDIAKWCRISFEDNPLSYAHNLYLNGSLVTQLKIPDGVTSIGKYSFQGCSDLTSVTIPDSVTSIGRCAFADSNGIEAFVVHPDNPSYLSIDGLLLTKDGKTIIAGTNGDVVIPTSVTSIGDCAFHGCSRLTSITIPESVTSIGFCAFECCSRLTNVTMQEGLISIEEGAFSQCFGLTSVTIPSSVTRIGGNAFVDCSGLTSMTIPEGACIGYRVFEGCENLKSALIVDSKNCVQRWESVDADGDINKPFYDDDDRYDYPDWREESGWNDVYGDDADPSDLIEFD